jgi:apolipoprotein D and lipocalin family protein
MKRKILLLLPLATLLALNGCRTLKPIRTASHVDLPRFMGDWYVIANIPTFVEKGAHNAVESYERRADGVILTTFTFNKGASDGPVKTYHPKGFVRDDPSNAVWGMRFIPPFKAEYRILYVDETYQRTVIGRRKRDYVWIMARSPTLSDTEFQELSELIAAEGYDISKLQRVPQRPDAPVFAVPD